MTNEEYKDMLRDDVAISLGCDPAELVGFPIYGTLHRLESGGVTVWWGFVTSRIQESETF